MRFRNSDRSLNYDVLQVRRVIGVLWFVPECWQPIGQHMVEQRYKWSDGDFGIYHRDANDGQVTAKYNKVAFLLVAYNSETERINAYINIIQAIKQPIFVLLHALPAQK